MRNALVQATTLRFTAKSTALALLLPLLGTASANHKWAPPITQVTSTDDSTLPRVASPGSTFCYATGPAGDARINSLKIYFPNEPLELAQAGDITPSAITCPMQPRVIAWESLAPSNTRRVVYYSSKAKGVVDPFANTPTVSWNPAVNANGKLVYFESTDDLAGQNPLHSIQVFQVSAKDPTDIRQLSRGEGDSRNPATSGNSLAFDSTSDPTTGADTGIPQIWFGDLRHPDSIAPITDGAAASEFPAVAGKGEAVAFQSRADLAGDGHDTGVPQIFLHGVKLGGWAQITNEPGGCTMPTARIDAKQIRVAYTCSGHGYFYNSATGTIYEIPTPPGSDTDRLVTELGMHFLVLNTTANMLGAGINPEHRIYVWNNWRNPAPATTKQVNWFVGGWH